MSIGTGTAIAIGAIAAGASTAYAAHENSQAADKQTEAAQAGTAAQTKANDAALAFEKQVYAQRQTQLDPYVRAGQGVSAQQANQLGITLPPSAVVQPPFSVAAPADGTTTTGLMPRSAVPGLPNGNGPVAAPTQFDKMGGNGVASVAARGLPGLVTVQAPDGSTKQMTQGEADLYQKIYGLKVINQGGPA